MTTTLNKSSAAANTLPKCLYERIRQRPPTVSPTFDALIERDPFDALIERDPLELSGSYFVWEN